MESKSTEDLIKSEVHQAIKLLSKTIKIIKTFLVLKYTKKINIIKEKLEILESNDAMVLKDKLEHEQKLLSDTKSINHQLLSVLIVKNKIPFGSDPNYNPMVLSHQEELSMIDRQIIDTILKDRRLQDNITTLQLKITTDIENNNKKRLMNENKKHHTSSKIDCSKAMFLDDLDEQAAVDASEASMDSSTQNDRDLRKLNKSLRNQENRRLNKMKRESDSDATNVDATSRYHQYDRTDSRYHQYDRTDSNGRDGTDYFPDKKRRKSLDNDPSLSMYRPIDQRLPLRDGSVARSSQRSTCSGSKDNIGTRLKKHEPKKNKSFGGRSTVKKIGSISSSASGDVDSSLDLVKAAAFGKEWQKTGVHPSWAAKQHSKQLTISSVTGKNGSIQSTGKKIIFDD